MKRKELRGMGVALITPFNIDGSVDYAALDRLVDYQVENNTDFLCVLGTTAETPTLSADEQFKVRQAVIKRNAGRLPILLGCGGNCTQNIIEKLKNDRTIAEKEMAKLQEAVMWLGMDLKRLNYQKDLQE